MHLTRLGFILLSLVLSGCAVGGHSSFFLTPGKFDTSDCGDLTAKVASTEKRVADLSTNVAKSETEPFGSLFGGLVYGPELASAREELHFLKLAAAERKCEPVQAAALPSPAKPGDRLTAPNRPSR